MSKASSSSSSGVGFFGLLAILFIALKLTGYIGWSWLWVLAPMWVPLCIVLAVLVIVGVIWLANELIKSKRRTGA